MWIYLVIGDIVIKILPKLINHLCLSLYAVYVLKNNFVNSGHLWENDHESLLVCLLIRHLSPLESHNTMYLSSWPDMGRISVWEFENLHRRKAFLMVLPYPAHMQFSTWDYDFPLKSNMKLYLCGFLCFLQQKKHLKWVQINFIFHISKM